MPKAKQPPKKVEIEPLVEDALKKKTALKKQVEVMSGSSRRERQVSSAVIYFPDSSSSNPRYRIFRSCNL